MRKLPQGVDRPYRVSNEKTITWSRQPLQKSSARKLLHGVDNPHRGSPLINSYGAIIPTKCFHQRTHLGVRQPHGVSRVNSSKSSLAQREVSVNKTPTGYSPYRGCPSIKPLQRIQPLLGVPISKAPTRVQYLWGSLPVRPPTGYHPYEGPTPVDLLLRSTSQRNICVSKNP